MTEWNWSENFTYDAASIAHPTSIDQLRQIVAETPKVKALGTRHSFNRVADMPGGTLVNVGGLEFDQPVIVDHHTMTAWVPAGWSYARVVAALEAEGVALPNMGSLPHISIAGATATGTHGSGDTNQMLSASIRGIELVTADGTLRRVDTDADDLPALAVGLGAFGVFTRHELDVEPSFLVQQEYYLDTSWATVLDNFDDIMASAYSVNLHAKFGVENVSGIWQKLRLESSEPLDVPDERWGMHRREGQMEPGKHTILHEPGPWSERLAHFVPGGAPSAGGDELQSEYFVDRRHGIDALNALRGMGDVIDPHLRGSEIRTVAADDLWMSPATGRDTLSIGFTWKKHIDEVTALCAPIEEALAPFEARPHWGKLFAMGRSQLVELYPKLDDFLDAVDRWDPNGCLANPFLARLR